MYFMMTPSPTHPLCPHRWVNENTPLNVATMTTAQWYRVLLEQEVTMVETEDNSMQYIRSRAELASPNTDWDTCWAVKAGV